MSKKDIIEEKTEKLLSKIADDKGVRVYDVEYVKEAGENYLRCFIDKDGGVNIDDCENVSRAMSDELDKDDFINDPYILEVSSPGLGRVLKKDRHLEYSLGEEVEIKTFKAIDKVKDFSGFLKSYDAENITIEVPVSEEETTDMVFNRKDIAVIRLALDF